MLGIASAAIDVSDGLAADLGHILEASGVGATLELDTLPLSPAFQRVGAAMGETQGARLALGAGDDYELCFTVPATRCERVAREFAAFDCGCRAIGVIEERVGLRVRQADGSPLVFEHSGYDHFAAP